MPDSTQSARDLRQTALSALVAGLLMGLVGFYLDLSASTPSAAYNASVTAFTWIMRVGGAAFLSVAVLAVIGFRAARRIEAVLSATTGAAMLVVSLIWLASGDLIDGTLVLLFGGMLLKSGLQQARAPHAMPRADAAPAADVHPPAARDGHPPAPAPAEPPEEPPGYLAALGRSDAKKSDTGLS